MALLGKVEIDVSALIVRIQGEVPFALSALAILQDGLRRQGVMRLCKG